MKRMIWFPTGRRMWLDLACKLRAQGVGTPVIWLGDDRLSREAAQLFPDANVIALRKLARGRKAVPKHSKTVASGKLWADQSWTIARDHILKLMDRDDKDGRLSAIEREALLHQLVTWSAALIEETRAEVLVMAESPHSAPQYVLYAVAKAMGLQLLSFQAWPLLPGLALRHGIDGELLVLPKKLDRTSIERSSFLESGRNEIDSYLALFETEGYNFIPRYMQIQANVATGVRDLKARPAMRRFASWVQLLLPRHQRAFFRRLKLKHALNAKSTTAPTGRFVYFPLHYEPERTTTPDGGYFNDQFRTISLLRYLLPPDVALVVKEHPSTFNPFMRGDVGRHPRHYAALSAIKGVHLLPHTHSSADLLRSCEGVATITGTVALEASALGKPSVVFGNPWFAGCPNTVPYSDDFAWDDIVAKPIQSRERLREWLIEQLEAFILPGTINPSNARYFAKWYQDGKFQQAELDALVSMLNEVLS